MCVTAYVARKRVGREVSCVARRRLQPCTRCYPYVQFNLPVWSLIPSPSLAPVTAGDWEPSSVDHLWVGPHNDNCNASVPNGVIPFSLSCTDLIDRARLWLTLLEFCPLKEQTAIFFCWLWQCLTCLYFLIVFQLARSDVIELYLYVSASESPILTSMMTLTWISHKTCIITPPLVSMCLSLPWRISSLDLVWTWCIRVLAHTDAEVKACQER